MAATGRAWISRLERPLVSRLRRRRVLPDGPGSNAIPRQSQRRGVQGTKAFKRPRRHSVMLPFLLRSGDKSICLGEGWRFYHYRRHGLTSSLGSSDLTSLSIIASFQAARCSAGLAERIPFVLRARLYSRKRSTHESTNIVIPTLMLTRDSGCPAVDASHRANAYRITASLTNPNGPPF